VDVIDVLGVPASPYTRKMLALMRYRQIPYRAIWGSHMDLPKGLPAPKVKLLPTIYLNTAKGKEAIVDSTPIIDRLEDLFKERAVRPSDEVLRFLDLLIEDFADEWLTKAMFHYRWNFSEGAKNAGPLIAYGQNPQLDAVSARAMADSFAKRQISRLSLVGSNQVTAPVIEGSFQRLIGILDRIIERQGFILGTQPASADFAIFGQLTQLGIIDPTSAQLLINASPRLRAWLDRVEDLSGHVGSGWIRRELVRSHVGELLNEIGRTYAPFLIANAQAIAEGKRELEATIDDQRWIQPVFPYQVKCMQALQLERQKMTKNGQEALNQVLAGTGCEVLFN
jgi:glutathione S-transferase